MHIPRATGTEPYDMWHTSWHMDIDMKRKTPSKHWGSTEIEYVELENWQLTYFLAYAHQNVKTLQKQGWQSQHWVKVI